MKKTSLLAAAAALVASGAVLASALPTHVLPGQTLPRADLTDMFVRHFYQGDLYAYVDSPMEYSWVGDHLVTQFAGLQITTAEDLGSAYRGDVKKADAQYKGKPVFVRVCKVHAIGGEMKNPVVVCDTQVKRNMPELTFEDPAAMKDSITQLRPGVQETFLCDGAGADAKGNPKLTGCSFVYDIAKQWADEDIEKIKGKSFSLPYFHMQMVAMAMTDQQVAECRKDRIGCWHMVNAQFAEIQSRFSVKDTAQAFDDAGIRLPDNVRQAVHMEAQKKKLK